MITTTNNRINGYNVVAEPFGMTAKTNVILNTTTDVNFGLQEREMDLSLTNTIPNVKTMINGTNKKLVIFADRFPLLYFVKEYNLEYDAAFKGCDTSKEANPKTIEKLTKKVIDNDIKIIFTIELSEANIASVIIDNCKKEGKNVLNKTFYTMHNVSKDDYKNGLTYIDYMNMNYEVLKDALN